MHISYLTIHELLKERNTTEAQLSLSESSLDIDEKAVELVDRLDGMFEQSMNVGFAEFDRSETSLFPQQFDYYIQDGSREEFVDFSRESLGVLRDSIETIRGARGGYFVYADYQARGQRYLGVYFIRKAAGMTFTKLPGSTMFSIDSVAFLDFDRLAMACRVDIAKYAAEQSGYLCFTRNARLKDFSEYFLDWLAADTLKLQDNKSYTEAMTMMIDSIPCPVDPATGEILERDDFKEQVLSYARSLPDKTLNVAEFSREFYNDDEYVPKFARENEHDIRTEFKPDIRLLQRSSKVDAFGEGIRLSFPANLMHKLIHFDERNPNRIIIDSAYLAEQVKRQVGK